VLAPTNSLARTHRMTGIMGGAAKVAKKATVKEIQFRWKDRWWGLLKDQILSTLDLRPEGGAQAAGRRRRMVKSSAPTHSGPPRDGCVAGWRSAPTSGGSKKQQRGHSGWAGTAS
jgi:hypothetical protein